MKEVDGTRMSNYFGDEKCSGYFSTFYASFESKSN